MKKKTFIVQLLNSKKPSRTSFTQVEDANFYSNDTDASLVFIPHEDTFDFQSAKVVMFNRGDESLVERDMEVTTEDGRKVANYELPDEIISHWGEWIAQPVFISGGEIYSGSIVPFSVFRYLMHERPPKLSEVVTITKLIQQTQALADNVSQEETERATQEQARQSAESNRVQAESERSDKYASYTQQFNDVITELSEEKDYHSLPEIAGARGGHETLGARLDETTAQLVHTATQVTYKNNLPHTLSNVITSDGSFNHVQWMTEDDVIYYSNGPVVRESSDYGETFKDIHNFNRSIAFIREIDGELLVGTRQAAESGGQIFKSSNNKTTWTMVLQLSNGSLVQPGWTVWVEDEIVLLGEYGLHGSATKVYLSNNKGVTFSNILDLRNRVTLPNSAHVHGVAYDKWFDRIWVVYGDGNTVLNGNTGVFYSDDLGINWKSMSVPSQLLTVFPFEDRVIFTSDSSPNGIFSYERGKKTEEPTVEYIYALDNESYLTYLPYFNYKKDDSSPLIMTWKLETGSVETDVTKFALASYNGKDWVEIWRDSQQHEKGDSSIAVVGPTKDNKLIGSMNFDNREWAITKIEGDYSYAVNHRTSKEITDNGEVDIRDLGVIGDGRDESGVLYNAIHYCARNSKVLVIPKDVSVTVRTVEVNGLNNFRMKVLGEIKVVDLGSGASASPIRFTNCTNLIIDEMNVNGNGSGQGSTANALHNMITLSECSDVTIGKLKVKNTIGRALLIRYSTRILVDSLHNDSENIGTSTLYVRNSKSIRFKDIVGEMGDIVSHDVSNIIIDSTEGEETSNVVIEKAVLKGAGRGAIHVDTDSTGIIENITINNVDIRLGDLFSHGDTNLILINNVKELKIQGEITGKNNLSRACRINNVSKSQIDLKVNVFNEGVQIGNIGWVSDSYFKLTYNDINKSSLLLGQVKNIVFDRLFFGENISSDLTSPYISNSGNVNWDNLSFDGGSARKDSTDSIPFLRVYHENIKKVKFKNFDLDDWRNDNPYTMFEGTAGTDILKVNCLGYNHRENTPNGNYTIAKKGEVIYNTNPQANGYLGWVCVGETPPTWKEFGKIEA